MSVIVCSQLEKKQTATAGYQIPLLKIAEMMWLLFHWPRLDNAFILLYSYVVNAVQRYCLQEV